uniref:Bestrophin homolog n=1 Tax=Romanomermis culicivorax TaxID=13658 RepID=A0A915J1S3_ROMCU
MTVTYSSECASERGWNFLRLLFRWRGSVYKILYKDLAIFLFFYFFISLFYRSVFTGERSVQFENLVEFCKLGVDLIPLTFVLGFFVTLIVDRWWNNFLAIPWPDRAAIKIACYVPGHDETCRLIRRTLIRYLNLSFAIVLRDLSSAVKKRFPTLDHLVIAGKSTKLFHSHPS